MTHKQGIFDLIFRTRRGKINYVHPPSLGVPSLKPFNYMVGTQSAKRNKIFFLRWGVRSHIKLSPAEVFLTNLPENLWNLQKLKKFLKVKSHSFLTMYNTWGLLSKDSELFNKMSKKITDFGENLVHRINYDHVHFFKHSFKIQIYPYVMVITGKLGSLAFHWLP